MNNFNCLLSILAILLIFFVVASIYLKFNYQKLSPIKILPSSKKVTFLDQTFHNVHELDSRYRYPDLPPANPMVNGSFVETVLPSSSDLYSTQTYTNGYTLLDQPDIGHTNDLNLSGNNTTLINIPLQYNEPYDEPLRTQAILVNDFNSIKYGKC